MKAILLLLVTLVSSVAWSQQEPTLVLHQPAMDKAIVEEGKKFMTSNDTTFAFDIYYPPGFNKKQQLPVVIFANSGSMDLYRWKIYRDWGRLLAANGIIGITYQARRTHSGSDLEKILDYVGTHSGELSIDKERIGIWSCSANVGPALPVAMNKSRSNVKALIVYYGFAQIQPADARQDLEMQVVRAGLDAYGINFGLDNFVKMALAQDLHLEYISYPEGQHAFDAFDDTPRSREIILQTVDFLKRTLSKDHPVYAKTSVTNSRLWNMIMVENKTDVALSELKTSVEMYRKMPGHNPFYNHLIDERNLNVMGYQLLGAGRNADAIKVFTANQELYPQSANVYDGLADAYERSNDKPNAVLNAKKTLEKLATQTDLQPATRDAIKASAEDKIKRLQ